MAEQNHQQQKIDMEFDHQAQISIELKRKKRMKLIAYAVVFAVFQTIVILVFSLTVMRIKNPKFRLHSVAVDDLTYTNANTSTPNPPSFNLKFTAEVAVKNTNFGHFKFENTTIIFEYEGVQVGEALVEKGRAKARSTKRMTITLDLDSNNITEVSNLGNEINSGFLSLTTHSRLSGKVHLMKLIKKKKSAEMNCAMIVDLVNKAVQDIKCQ